MYTDEDSQMVVEKSWYHSSAGRNYIAKLSVLVDMRSYLIISKQSQLLEGGLRRT